MDEYHIIRHVCNLEAFCLVETLTKSPHQMVKAHSNTNDVKRYSGNTDHYFSVGHWQAVNTYEGTADIHALVLGGQPRHLSRSQSLLTYVRPRADGTSGV